MRFAPAFTWVARIYAILAAPLECVSALDSARSVTQYGHTAWTRQEGRLPGGVFALTQTLDGRLWVGTEFGLFFFDGLTFSPFKPTSNEQLPSQVITALGAPPDGSLWIATRNVVSRWNGTAFQRYEMTNGIRNVPVSAIRVDRGGNIWIGTVGFGSGGLARIESARLHSYTADQGFNGGAVLSLYEDHSGNLWIGCVNGLYRWHDGGFQRYGENGPSINVGAIAENLDGSIIASYNDGAMLKRLVGGILKDFPVVNNGERLRARVLLFDRHGGLWIGTDGQGLIHHHSGRVERFSSQDGLSGSTVISLFEDREGNIWAGTERGLDRFRDVPVAMLTVREGLSEDTVSSVFPSKSGGVWIGTGKGLDRVQGNRIKTYDRKSGLPSESIGSVFEDRDGKLWVGSARGLAVRANDRFHVVDLPGSQKIRAIAAATEDRDGVLWFSDLERGLISAQRGVIRKTVPWSRFENKQAVALAADPKKDEILLGFSQGGVARYRPDTPPRWYSAADGLGAGMVTDFLIDSQGVIWIATEGGLSRLNDGRIATLDSKNGLRCDRIHALVEDHDGGIWLNTPCGLQHLTRQDLAAWMTNPAVKLQPKIYSGSDGMHSRALRSGYSRGGAISADGRIWFPATDGIAVVDPKNLHENRLPPPVTIEAIHVNDKIYAPKPKSRFGPNVRDLQIDYAAFSLTDADRNRFRYKLVEYDDAWRDALGRRQAFYSMLPPGTYRFLVVAANNDGVWSKNGAEFDFTVEPTLYQMLWFRVLTVITMSAMVVFLWDRRLKLVKAKIRLLYEERMRERARIGRELHDTLLQNICGLGLQLEGWSKVIKDPSSAKEGLSELRRETEQWLHEARELIWDLRSDLNDGVSFAETLHQIAEKATSGLSVSTLY